MKATRKSGRTYFSVDNWKEIFTYRVSNVLVRSLKEGDVLPPFYLPVQIPVQRRPDVDAYEMWIFPLAPIVFMLYLLKAIIYSVSRDCVQWLDDIRELNKYKS